MDIITSTLVVVGVYLGLYFSIYQFLKNTSEGFQKLDYDRRMYIVKNYVKATALGLSCHHAFKQTYYILFDTDSLTDNFLQMNAIMYVLTDTLGLILVRGLPINTKLHHLATNVLGIYVLSATYGSVCAAYLPVLYAGFSTWAFIVNFYLAFRAHTSRPRIRMALSAIAFINYALISVLNWFVQIVYVIVVFRNIQTVYECIFPFLYSWCLVIIIKDDIILMDWLKKDFWKLWADLKVGNCAKKIRHDSNTTNENSVSTDVNNDNSNNNVSADVNSDNRNNSVSTDSVNDNFNNTLTDDVMANVINNMCNSDIVNDSINHASDDKDNTEQHDKSKKNIPTLRSRRMITEI